MTRQGLFFFLCRGRSVKGSQVAVSYCSWSTNTVVPGNSFETLAMLGATIFIHKEPVGENYRSDARTLGKCSSRFCYFGRSMETFGCSGSGRLVLKVPSGHAGGE